MTDASEKVCTCALYSMALRSTIYVIVDNSVGVTATCHDTKNSAVAKRTWDAGHHSHLLLRGRSYIFVAFISIYYCLMHNHAFYPIHLTYRYPYNYYFSHLYIHVLLCLALLRTCATFVTLLCSAVWNSAHVRALWDPLEPFETPCDLQPTIAGLCQIKNAKYIARE